MTLFRRRMLARVGFPLVVCLVFFGIQSWLIASGSSDSHVLVADGGNPSDKQNPVLLAQAGRVAIMPQVLYQRAWRLIRETYYEPKFVSTVGDDKGDKGQDWNRWKHRYDGKLKTLDDAHKAIETMLYSLNDPYTRFLDREAFDEERSQIEAHLFGVGMQLGMNKEHKVVVISPIEGTPAANAGIHPGDEIVEVDGKPVKGQSLDQVVKQIRGPINTKVGITFMRKTEKRKVSMSRAEIPIRAVADCEILPGNIGYIRLDSFISSKANSEMRES